MKPDKESIEKFRKIYREEFGEEISSAEAYEKFLRLINVVRVVLRPASQIGQDEENLDPSSG